MGWWRCASTAIRSPPFRGRGWEDRVIPASLQIQPQLRRWSVRGSPRGPWFRSSRGGSLGLVEGAAAEHGEECVAAASGEDDAGPVVAFALGALVVAGGPVQCHRVVFALAGVQPGKTATSECSLIIHPLIMDDRGRQSCRGREASTPASCDGRWPRRRRRGKPEPEHPSLAPFWGVFDGIGPACKRPVSGGKSPPAGPFRRRAGVPEAETDRPVLPPHTHNNPWRRGRRGPRGPLTHPLGRQRPTGRRRALHPSRLSGAGPVARGRG
jgi:hypothetical protein